MSGSTPAVPQLPLALRYPPDQRLDTYVAAPAGTIEQLQALATTPEADAALREEGIGRHLDDAGQLHAAGVVVLCSGQHAGLDIRL